MIRTSLCVLATLGCGHAPPVARGRPSAVATLPFELYGTLVVVQVGVAGGEPRPFLLDSGWNPSALDADIATQLGVAAPPATMTAAPGGEVPLAKAPSLALTIGALHFAARDADLVPLHPLGQVIGRTFDGILGNDLFERYVVEIDYARHQLSLYEPATYVHGAGEVLALEVTAGEPFVHGVIVVGGRSHPAKLKIDTGSIGGLGLNGSYVQAQQLFPANTPRITMLGAAVGGRTKNFASRADELQLGAIRVPGPVGSYSEDLSRGGDAGTLGGEILHQFTVTFDHLHHELILDPKDRRLEPEAWDMIGMTVAAVAPALRELVIVDVIDGSPAAAAGLAQGDVVLAAEGSPISLIDLWQRQRRSGTMRLRIRHGTAEREVSLVARAMI